MFLEAFSSASTTSTSHLLLVHLNTLFFLSPIWKQEEQVLKKILYICGMSKKIEIQKKDFVDYCKNDKIKAFDFAKEKGISLTTLNNRLREYGLKKRQTNYLPKDVSKKIEQMYKSGLSIRDIYSTGIASQSTIGKIIKNIARDRSSGQLIKDTKKVDHYYFDKLSPNSAYLLGILFTDGSVRNDGYCVSLYSIDRYLCELLKKETKSKHSIQERSERINKDGSRSKKAYVISLSSKKLVISLNKLGLYANKTFDMNFPNLPNKLVPHFIRGLIDGDGCIHFNKGVVLSFVCASKSFMDSFRTIIKKEFGFEGSIYTNRNGVQTIRYHSNQALKILDCIYKDSENARLERKYLKFKKYAR